MKPIEEVTIDRIEAAQRRLEGLIVRTPLIRLNDDSGPGEIHLKLENLQPIGSFKLRGALNALRTASAASLAHGVYTASAGNMAQGLAHAARAMNVACRAIVPEGAPITKIDAIRRLGADVIKVSFDQWWRVMQDHGSPDVEGLFVHPVCQAEVIAGNGTVGLEILEDLPDVNTVVVPFGGGGLSCGIATALRARKPEVRVYASETETAAPLAASLKAGRAQTIEHSPSFVDGIGGKSVFDEMWPMVNRLLSGSITVSLREIANAIRLLVERNRVVAEGAGASSVAAALTGRAGSGPIVCVISGGNIDSGKLATILEGGIPGP